MKTSRIAATGAVTLAVASAVVAMPKMGMMDDKMMDNGMMMNGMMMSRQSITMMPLPPAKMVGLQNAMGNARVDMKRRTVKLAVTLPPGATLPAGTVLEGWLSTAGKKTSSNADEKFGPAFGKPELAMKLAETPYALSTGLLRRKGNSRTYVGNFHIDNPLTPYGAVAVTLESDGNTGVYDPRPGTPLMAGPIKS